MRGSLVILKEYVTSGYGFHEIDWTVTTHRHGRSFIFGWFIGSFQSDYEKFEIWAKRDHKSGYLLEKLG